MSIQELIILFIVSFLSATLSGIAGFGGALILLPFLTNILGTAAAIPVLTIGQLFGNASRVWLGRHELKWKPISLFLFTAVPFTLLGSYLFTATESAKIKFFIGLFLILLVVYRRSNIKKIAFGDTGMLTGGGLTGFLSGLAGSAGPLGAAFFLGLNLAPATYIASEAFTALIMHITKIFIYNYFLVIKKTELYYGLFMGLAMILGSWAGKQIVHKINRKTFIYLVELLLIVSGIQLIFKAM